MAAVDYPPTPLNLARMREHMAAQAARDTELSEQGIASVAVASMTGGGFEVEWVAALLASIKSPDRAWKCNIQLDRSGPYLDVGRNKMITGFFLDSDNDQCSRLVMIDSDIGWSADDLNELVAACTPETPVTSGVYHNAFPGHRSPWPVVYSKSFHHGRIHYDNVPPFVPGDGPYVEVDGIGAGFMCVHRTLLEAMVETYPEPHFWFAEEFCEGTYLGEDLCFCWRVQQMGFPIIVLPHLQLTHTKMTTWARPRFANPITLSAL